MDISPELLKNKSSCVIEIGFYTIKCNLSNEIMPIIINSPVYNKINKILTIDL